MMADVELKAPFPYFGGKSRIADEAWSRLGNVDNYVEAFAGSAAMLLARSDRHAWWDKTETINDYEGMVANFWRATKHAPDIVAEHADNPINENDLHARKAWLSPQRETLRSKLEGDPDWYDPKIAGWWVWGLSTCLAGGFCASEGPWIVVNGELVNRNDCNIDDNTAGVARSIPQLGGGTGVNSDGISRSRPQLNSYSGVNASHMTRSEGVNGAGIVNFMRRLAHRLRRVRVCCGDWSRVCTATPTWRQCGITGVFLDPPYAMAGRSSVYATEMDVLDGVREWCIEMGAMPQMRIILCGYDTDHEMPADWTVVEWETSGGLGRQAMDSRGRDNAKRERLWCSPNCITPDEARPQITMDLWGE